VVLVVGALALDLTQRTTRPHPFAAVPITRGAPITPDMIEWRDVPAGLLEVPDLTEARAGRRLLPGEPILPTALASEAAIPDGWWSVPMVLPDGVEPGARVRVVTVDPPLAVDGIVVSATEAGAFATGRTGLIAIPGQSAAMVAAAAVDGNATVLFAP